jgi:tetratricopeptide (TPR) repeat protein
MSSRARARVIVAVVAAAAATAAGVLAWAGRADEGQVAEGPGGPREGAPPLVLDALVDDPAEAAALRSAATLYEGGDRAAALLAFSAILERDPAAIYAAIGAAFSRWPDGTLDDLQALAEEQPGSGLVQLHLGLALLWTGRDPEAQEAWRAAEELEPDTSAAVRAESLLHPEMPAGRPFFVPGEPLPRELENQLPALQLEQLEQLEQRAATQGSARAWIDYGTALQRAGATLSAVVAFERAAELEPESPEALVAAAIARFDKDAPSETFSRLGPLTDRFPEEDVVRYHLGLSLLWLGSVDEAKEQLARALDGDEATVWSREAQRLLDELANAAAG